MKKHLLSLVAVLSLTGDAFADPTPDHKVNVVKHRNAPAILGYHAGPYFTDNKALKGGLKFISEYEGAKLHHQNDKRCIVCEHQTARKERLELSAGIEWALTLV